MSLASWRKEFYPKAASKIKESEALLHSIRKWEGLIPENLERHGLSKNWRTIYDNDSNASMYIADDTCALCYHYLKIPTDESGRLCTACPLKKIRRVSCDQDKPGSKAPYGVWVDTGNPVPMQRLLKAALRKFGK